MATDTPFPTSSAETTADTGRDTTYRSAPLSDELPRSAAALDDRGRDSGVRADDLIGRIAQSAHETIDRLAETAAPHVNRLQENLSGDALQMRADEMREFRDEWAESLRCTVRDNPLAAVGVALAVGVLIARLSR
jgi:ElaB/YqjD/DUF883 family membrane-anchored ribosome-binding protein